MKPNRFQIQREQLAAEGPQKWLETLLPKVNRLRARLAQRDPRAVAQLAGAMLDDECKIRLQLWDRHLPMKFLFFVQEFNAKSQRRKVFKIFPGVFALKGSLWFRLVRVREYTIALPDCIVRDAAGAEARLDRQSLALMYLNTADGTPPEYRWLRYRELPGGLFYAHAFQGYAEKRWNAVRWAMSQAAQPIQTSRLNRKHSIRPTNCTERENDAE